MRSPTASAPWLAALALACTASPAAAAPKPAPDPANAALAYSSFVLPNGLRVLLHEDHTVPIVGVELFYHVGSKDEVPGKTGFAHLFEHLMFKGSRNVADGEHFQRINEAGGTLNATTNRDRTNYFEVLPSSFLERALFLESDRMAHLLDGLTQATFDNQRDVVRNERRQNYENRPYGRAHRPLVEALFPPDHPYHWLTIGDHADLMRATIDDVRAFFRKHYRPGNATLAIAGDLDPAETRRLVEKHFGPIPSDPTDPQKPPSLERSTRPPVRMPPPLTSEKRIDLDDQVSLERVTLAWLSAPAFQPGDAAYDLLGLVLGPTAGRLQRRLVHELQLAQNVSVEQNGALLAGDFEITVTVARGHTADEVVAIIDEELGKIRGGQAPVTAAELEQAKNRYEAELYFGLMPVGGFGGRTGHLLAYEYFTGDPGYLGKDVARYRAVTTADVDAAARSLGPGRVRVVIHPSRTAGKEAAK
jgi:zinc protease